MVAVFTKHILFLPENYYVETMHKLSFLPLRNLVVQQMSMNGTIQELLSSNLAH